jgi:hypothetical protein
LRFEIVWLLAAVAVCYAADPAEARWEGGIQIPGRSLPVVIDLARGSGGEWIGSATLPGLNIEGAPLKDIAIQNSTVRFTLKGALAEPTFNGRIGEDGVLAGTFQQSGNTAPFRLQKAGAPQVDPPRTSTPVTKDLEGGWLGNFTFNGAPMKATLKLENHESGAATADFHIVGKRDNVLPVDRVALDGEWLTVSVGEYHMAYEGQFHKDSGEISGSLKQGPLAMPLVFHRQ